MYRLNRESIEWLSEGGRLTMKEMHDVRMREGKPIVLETDFYGPISELYEALYQMRNNERVFVISQTTRKRVENMDIKSLLNKDGGLDLVIQGTNNELCTIVVQRDGPDREPLSAVYYIPDGKRLYMMAYLGVTPIGYVSYIDGRCDVIPYSLFSMMRYNSYPASKAVAKAAEPLMVQINKDFGEDGEIPLSWLTRRRAKQKGLNCAEQVAAYFNRQDLLEFILKTIVFMKTSEVYSRVFVPDQTPTYRRKRGYRPLNYVRIDSTWDMDIDVNTPFPVRGHFVHQPCKIDGEWTRKLIYVEQYMKKGYHRKAKKTKEGI